MSAGRFAIIMAVVRKDLRLWTRDRFMFFMSFGSLIIYLAFFWLMPSAIDETLRLGLSGPGAAELEAAIQKMAEREGEGDASGLGLIVFPSRDALVEELNEGEQDLFAGVVLPADARGAAQRGQALKLEILLGPKTPPEVEKIAEVAVREMFLASMGAPLPVTPMDDKQSVIGKDRAGKPITAKEHARPFLALMVMAMEMMALGSLVSKELSGRTVTALLATPLRLWDFLIAKGIVGVVLAFGQALVLATFVGALPLAPFKLVFLLFLGSLTFVGLGLIAGAKGKDFTEVLFWSLLFLIPSILPGVAVLMPGSTSLFVMTIPTYPVMVALHGATAKGLSWGELLPYIGASAAWAVGLFTVGLLFLMRKVNRL